MTLNAQRCALNFEFIGQLTPLLQYWGRFWTDSMHVKQMVGRIW